MKDYHKVLGVPKGAGESEIKKAYRRLALIYHPDRNRSPGAEAKFREISEAYAVLTGKASAPVAAETARARPGRHAWSGMQGAPIWAWRVISVWQEMEREKHNNMYR